MRLRSRPALLLVLSSLLVTATACRRGETSATAKLTSASASVAEGKPPAAPPEAAPPVKPFVASHEVPPFTGDFPHRADPVAAAAERVVGIRFVRNGGDGDVAPVFALTNLTKEKVRVGQTWLYYYDAEKKRLDSYPHSLSGSLELEPGETKEERLGWTIGKLPAGTALLEGEVSSATVGGKEWINENLAELNARRAGGPDAQTLADRAGERVIVDVYTIRNDRVRLTNVTDRPVKSVDVHLFYATAKGSIDSRWAPSQKLERPLAPGESMDVTLKMLNAKDRPPAGAVKVVAFADEVDFTDGTKFTNRNLAARRRWAGLETKTAKR